jgi:site-specific recombinase XerD
MTFEQLIKLYGSYLVAMGKAASTIKSYLSVINHFYRELQGKEILQLKKKDFLFFLNDNKKAKMTLYCRALTLNSFFNWLTEEHYILKNPMMGLELMRLPKTLPKNIMTQGEAFKLLEAVPLNENNHVKFRDRTIYELLYSCSLRRSELVALNKNDFDPSTRSLRIKAGKTHKGRLVPVGQYACDLLDQYLSEIRPKSDSEALFVTDRKRDRLSVETITTKVYRLRKAVKIRTKASSHSFRKSSATHMLRNGASLLTVQALLGHAAITSTQAYTKLYPKDLIKMHRANHPREKHKNVQLPELKVPEYLYAKVKFQPK